MTIVKYLYIILVFILLSVGSNAQPGSVRVIKDSRMDILAKKQADLNKRSKTPLGTRMVRGYRIQVYNDQNRNEANAVKTDLLRRFPDQKTYLIYQSPNFRVRIGNFLSQREAGTLRKMIATLYPQYGIFVVADRVEYKPPADDED